MVVEDVVIARGYWRAPLRYLSFVTVPCLRYVKQFPLSPELFTRVYKTVVYFLIFFGKPLGVCNQVKTQFSQSWYVILLYKYWDLLTEWQWWKNRSGFSHSQSATQTVNFLSRKNIVRGVWLDERCFFTCEKWSWGKPPHFWRENWRAVFSFLRCW